MSEIHHHEACERFMFITGTCYPGSCLGKYRRRPRMRARSGVAVRKPVIREPAPMIVEVTVALLESIEQVVKPGDGDVGCLFQPREPCIENFRAVYHQRPVGSEGR